MERDLLLLNLRGELNRKVENLRNIRSDIEKLRDKLEEHLRQEQKLSHKKEG